jgi:hypothetical protein
MIALIDSSATKNKPAMEHAAPGDLVRNVPTALTSAIAIKKSTASIVTLRLMYVKAATGYSSADGLNFATIQKERIHHTSIMGGPSEKAST